VWAKVQNPEKGTLNEAGDMLNIGLRVKTERREKTQFAVILLGRIYCFITGLCRIKYHVDMELGEIG